MARLLNPEPYTTIYDPACGSGGLLIKPRLLFEQAHPDEKSQARKSMDKNSHPRPTLWRR